MPHKSERSVHLHPTARTYDRLQEIANQQKRTLSNTTEILVEWAVLQIYTKGTNFNGIVEQLVKAEEGWKIGTDSKNRT